jgi:putative tryptophan/tyrosine transport system substrate-binding protein
MKKSVGILVCAFLCVILFNPACFSADKIFKIEVLQVCKIGPYDDSYKGFVSELAKNGLVQGKNLTINRKIIDFDIDKGGLWKKIGVLMDLKKEAARIVEAKPDLVLTIGTVSTKYAKDKIIAAGIPVVFTGVAIPEAAGCQSLSVAGPGFTGSTLYMDMNGAMKIIRLGFPNIKTLGMIYSDDENAVAHKDQAQKAAPGLGFTLMTKKVGKSDDVAPAAKELLDKGVQAFVMPLDTYYGLRDYEPQKGLCKFGLENKVPVIALVNNHQQGFIMSVGSDFRIIGEYSAQQAAKILKEGAKPESMPIRRQDDLNVLVDVKVIKALGTQLPLQLLQVAKSI